MPRAKVKDEDRQRARKACIPCKNSKIRCDAQEPCANCIKKNRVARCQYVAAEQSSTSFKVARRFYHQTSPQSASSQTSYDQTEQTTAGKVGTDQDVNPARSDAGNHGLANAQSQEVTHARMLLNAKGEKMYIGKYSSISLLEVLRQTVRHQVGPSRFSDAPTKNVMLEADIRTSDNVRIEDYDIEYKQDLVQMFFEVSSGVLDLFDEDEVYHFLSRNSQSIQSYDCTDDDRTALLLIMAIGAQARGQEPHDLKFASNCFAQARTLAFEGNLCDPSINMVRAFILLAYYIIGACRRNAGYMYLGIAAKAACALGLHSRSRFLDLSPSEQDSRARIWKSLYVVDTIVNAFLGRPGTLPLVQPEQVNLDNESQSHRTRSRPLDAAYGACTHIALIMPTVSNTAELDYAFTEDFLEKLGKWREITLPTTRKYTFGLSALPAFESAGEQTGSMHVACIYYYAVILVTRPFLLSHLTSKLRLRTTSGTDHSTATAPVNPKTARLAEACLDASTYMTSTCERVMNSDGLRDNMCLLNGFLFSAGLLLGYSIFIDGKASDNEDAFRSALAVLRKFSTLSPQGRHYFEILLDFHDASNKYHQMLQDQRRKTTTQYVKPILPIEADSKSMRLAHLTPNTDTSQKVSNGAIVGLGASPVVLNGTSSTGDTSFMDVRGMGMNNSLEFGTTSIDFDTTVNIPFFWDDTFDWSLFSGLPDEVSIGM